MGITEHYRFDRLGVECGAKLNFKPGDWKPSRIFAKPKRKRNMIALLLCALLVLTLAVGVYAASFTNLVETKSNWGENGVIVLPLGSPPYDMGIRIDGSYLILL